MFLSPMARKILPLAALALLSTGAMATESRVPASWGTVALEKLKEAEYRFGERPDGAWSAPNRAQSVRSFVTGTVGLRVIPRTAIPEPWELRLNLEGIGRGDALSAPGPVTLSSEGNRIERHSRGLVEWFVNEPKGIEHGFTLASPPAGLAREVPLVLELAVEGDLAAWLSGDRTGITFTADSGQHVLSYEHLAVFDARGDRLDARFEYAANRLRIVVDDRGAAYPIVVDPLVTVPDWSDTSNQSGSEFGVSVAGAGDLNADGFDDVIVGAPRYDNGEADEGHVFVYLGSPGGPDTDPIWHAESDHPGARFGRSVAGNCNVNDDAYADVIFGAPYWDDGTDVDEGAAFVYYGSPNALNPELLRPVGLPTNADWKAEGDRPVSEMGLSVACAGDVNDDLVADIIVGARNYTNDQSVEGAAFVFHGSTFADGLAQNATRPVGNPSNADWSGESNQVSAEYGHSVASAGDINNDGVDDILVGAPSYQNNFFDEGRAYAYLGTPSGVQSTPIWVQDGGVDDGAFGSVVASAGNVNGDNLDDVLIGAEDWTNGQLFEGGAFLFLGKSGGLLGATPDWTLELNQTGGLVGSSVASAGDFNSDGFDDVVVSAEGLDDGELDEGAVFLFLGSPTGLPTTPARQFEVDQEGADFGESVASAGDVNGDGFDDILIGADRYSLPEVFEGGAFIFYGCEDSDRDGICQIVDNCPLLINPDQDDTDGDGIGDTCDACEDIDEDDVCDKPRVLVDWSGPGEQVIIEYGSPMRFMYNTFVNPNIFLNWVLPTFDDTQSPWQAGLYGVGFEQPPAGAPVGASDLLVTTNPPVPGSVSIYTRADFTIPSGTQVDTLFLGVDYDDAYAAWINGVEVYRSGEMPSGVPEWNSAPTRSHESSNGAVPIYDPLQDISFSGIPALNIGGGNTLAIGVWNSGPGSSDLVLVPRLSINRPVTHTMRYKANAVDPQLGLSWTEFDFAEESTWDPGNYGVGYEIGTGAEDLINTETPSVPSIFSRAKFNVAASAIDSVFLGADWDDGYVAWINGQEVHRTAGMPGAPGSLPGWNVSGVPEHESSNLSEPDFGTLYDITTSALSSIVDGENVLALGVWRNDIGGVDDLVLVPRLSINESNVDNCIGVANPLQGDVDDDGLGDDCDPDIDGDTLPNGSDNCPYDANFNQDNCDADATGDVCDPCPCDADDDVDADGICDGAGYNPPKDGDLDNCPSTYNPYQEDENLDGEGDACDPDIDGDGHLNGADNCPYTPNDQTDVDGDDHGLDCDCNDGDINVWAKPSAIDTLRLVRDDVCVAFTCTESQAPCGTDADCLVDTCGDFACTESSTACTTNAECLKDECANFTCSVGANGCGTDSDCFADFCSTKTCTVGFNGCATDGDCIADACANKMCTESPTVACNTNLDCVNSPTDICIGSCTLGNNPCVTDAACTLDRCEGTCSVGGNICTNDTVCTQDVCEGSCTVGGNTCTDDSVCTQPQTDICRGSCSLGSNPCFDDLVCTQAQTDVCQGSCSLSDATCVFDSQCSDPSADTLRWQVPQVLGANTVRYDTLRSLSDTDFTTATTCVETDGADSKSLDPALPTTGEKLFFYLIRIENDCPTTGDALGGDWQGTERSGRTCP